MIFLKLGGSLITQKDQPRTARPGTIARLASEIAAAREADPRLQLLLGHGSGSFGHHVAAQYGTQEGARSAADWRGFAQVWRAAQQINRLVVDLLCEAGLPAISFPPSASALCASGRLVQLAVEPIQRALQAGLLPVVYGDVAFDQHQGAAIVSTEQVLSYLARSLKPKRLLLAGLEPGVYAQYPQRTGLLSALRAADLEHTALATADATDVTGGMAAKVRQALEIARTIHGMEVRIFSGEPPGNLERALRGEPLGTSIIP